MPISGLRTAWPSDQLASEHATAAFNVRIKFGRVRPAPGRQLFGGHGVSEEVWYIGTFSLVDGTTWVVKLTESGAYRWGDASPATPAEWHQISGPAFTGSGRWGVATGEDHLFFSRLDEPGIYQWDGNPASNYALIVASGGIVPAAKFLAYYNDRLIALHVKSDPTGTPVVRTSRVQWPVSGNYTDWGGSGSGFLDIFEGIEEPIANAAVLGGRLVVFRGHSVVDFVRTGATPGSGLIHTAEVRTLGIGTDAPYTVVPAANGVIYFLGRDMNVWSWDGVTAKPVSLAIEDTLKSLVDPSKLDTYFGASLPNQQEYWFVLDTGDVFVYDYLRDIWLRDVYPSITAVAEVDKVTGSVGWDTVTSTWDMEARTWAEMSGFALATILAGRSTGETFEITDKVSSDYFTDGSIVNRYIETGDIYLPTIRNQDGDTMSANGRIKRALITYDYVGSDPFEVWVSNTFGRTWPVKVSVTPDMRGYSFVDFDLSSEGGPFRFRFKEEDANGQFRWSSYSFEFLPGDV